MTVDQVVVLEDADLPPALRNRRRRISERVPTLYPLAVELHRLKRHGRWLRSSTAWSNERSTESLPVRVKQHKSILLRQLGDSEMWMQHNKLTNLRLAAAQLDGILIRPGEEFSFCRLVGRTSKRRGYVDGMLLDNGEAAAGVGGGICQVANLLHWMVLHTPLVITERSEHSFDPFPDNGRVLPWGVGCTIYYNYVDLCFRNDTEATIQLRVAVGEKYLEGEVRSDRPLEHSYSVYAKDERFFSHDGSWFRQNEIWRNVIDRRTENTVGNELLKRNCALVKYLPAGVESSAAGEVTTVEGSPPPPSHQEGEERV